MKTQTVHLITSLPQKEIPQTLILVIKIRIQTRLTVQRSDTPTQIPAVLRLGGEGGTAHPYGPEVSRMEMEYGPGCGECGAGEAEDGSGVAWRGAVGGLGCGGEVGGGCGGGCAEGSAEGNSGGGIEGLKVFAESFAVFVFWFECWRTTGCGIVVVDVHVGYQGETFGQHLWYCQFLTKPPGGRNDPPIIEIGNRIKVIFRC